MKKVLVIAPHMDDEVLGAGGVIAKHVLENCKVLVCFVCNRAYQHKYNERMINEEKKNAIAAMKELGYKSQIFLDLNDERLDECVRDVLIPLEKVVSDFKPGICYIPHKGDNNQDHRVVFQTSMIALRSFAAPYVEEIYSYEIPSSTEQSAPLMENVFMPNVYVDIKKFMHKKIRALGCYAKEKRQYPHPRSKKAVGILAKKRGVEAYMEMAEAFMLMRKIERG